MADVKFARGTQTQYDAKLALNQISADKLYYTTDTHRIYMGTILMDGGSAIITYLTTQTPGATIEDGVGLKISNASYLSIYNTWISAVVSRFVLTISNSDSIVFNINETNGATNKIYMYAYKNQQIYYIELSPSGSDMVGTLHIVDFIYPDGDEVNY